MKQLAKNNNFIERSILSAVTFLKEAVICEEYADRKGLLQSLDPRIKTISFLLFLITVVSLKHVEVVAILYVLCLALVLLSNISLGFFLFRTWVFIPLFSLFIAVPALFSFITPGIPLWEFNIFGLKLIITQPGFNGAVLFVARVVSSVSFVVLLSLTTRHSELLKVLRVFNVPKVFVLTASMCYRYVYLFTVMIGNIFTAIKSRVGRNVHYKKGQHIVAWNIAGMWSRAYKMNEDVYDAMLSRGYTGEPKLLSGFHAGLKDWLWLVFSLGVCIIIFYFGGKG